METILLKGMLLGGIAVATTVAGLFFLKFWHITRDRLFLFFACSFFLQALSRVLMGIHTVSSDEHPVIYVIRLCAYALIIGGIVDKNMKHTPASVPKPL
jgi:hypothetical protein